MLHALAMVALLAVSVTGASAQVDPYATTERQATQNDIDTDITPVAKESELWTLVHGAEYPDTQVIDGSLTSFDTDLFDVAFRNLTIGLAGGSACPQAPVQQRGESDAGFGERVASCEAEDGTQADRIPALYRYSQPENEDPRWDRIELEGDEHPGYVGAIAWIDPNRALIVGGSGTYPLREPAPDGRASTDPEKEDPAGAARAWIYTKSTDSVSELDLSTLTPDLEGRAGMRGLTAVDCAGPSLCFAGALGQIWEWQDGAFVDKRIDAQSPPAILKDASLFRYRVRDINGASAYTAGCCSTGEAENTPRVIVREAGGVWSARDLVDRVGTLPSVPDLPPASHASPLPTIAPVPPLNTPKCVAWPLGVGSPTQGLNSPDTWPCLLPTLVSIPPPVGGMPLVDQQTADRLNEQIDVINGVIEGASQATVEPLNEQIDRFNEQIDALNGQIDAAESQVGELNVRRRELNDKPTWPDSIYSAFGSSAILTPGGVEDERPSVIAVFGGNFTSGLSRPLQPEMDLLRISISTARLYDGDGDFAKTDPVRPAGFDGGSTAFAPLWLASPPNLGTGDGVPDWVMGELRSTERPGLGARGLLVATALPPTLRQSVNEAPSTEEVAGWEPVDKEKLDAHIDSRHFLLPSYSVRAIDIVGAQEDGWAVGAHGAILRISSAATQATEGAAEPKPPKLGAPRPKRLADRSAYEQRDPGPPASAGLVPTHGGETIQVDEPRMVPVGPTGVSNPIVVMSRDGSEGWAISTTTSLSHYAKGVWKPCDPVGLEGASQPDPACEEMAKLGSKPLRVAARVPYENDADPTNDDEFEIVAIGDTVVRYRDGRWRPEDPKRMAGLPEQGLTTPNLHQPHSSLAFTQPDDGWLLHHYASIGGGLFHFDGDRWVDCRTKPALCDDPARRLPQFGQHAGVQLNGVSAAGNRVYAFGRRPIGNNLLAPVTGGSDSTFDRQIPAILYKDPDGTWTDGSGDGEDNGGFDPGFSDLTTEQAGEVDALSVTQTEDGGFEGWAVGTFKNGVDSTERGLGYSITPYASVLMRLGPDGWRRYPSKGPLNDYLMPRVGNARHPQAAPRLQVTYPSEQHPNGTFFAQRSDDIGDRVFGFNATRGRFDLLDLGRPPSKGFSSLAPDGQGGFWAASVSGYAFHYTDRIPKPLFEEAPNPIGTRSVKLRDIAAGPDGSVWVATDSDRVFRYDRLGGWEEARIGWDPGRVVVRASQASAIAIGPGGGGLVVGEAGRIADLSPEIVVINPAAGRSCGLGDPIPCGTSRDLNAVEIAADGSAIAAGDRLALLWRPPGGEFRALAKPAIAAATDIELVSFPTPERAYLYTDRGIVFRGQMSSPGEWRWQKDNTDEEGEVLTVDEDGEPFDVTDFALNADGHGYAVGEGALIYERSEGEGWRRIANPYPGDASPSSRGLTAVELAPGGGPGVLFGGKDGLILSGDGNEIRVARPADFRPNSNMTGEVLDFAYLAGSTDASVDAWAAIASLEGQGFAGLSNATADRRGDGRLLRYRSDPADPLLEPSVGLSPLSDVPPQTEAELSIAAFGKSDCSFPESDFPCPEMTATTTTNELILERTIDELVAREKSGELDVALMSGDAIDSPGYPGESLANTERVAFRGELKHRRYKELVVDELEEKGVPMFGAIGGQDLTDVTVFDIYGNAQSTRQFRAAGENYSWREAFAKQAEPWGGGQDVVTPPDEVEFVPVPGSDDGSLRIEDQTIDADGDGAVPEQTAAIGGAATHYAVDAVRDGEPVARIVVVDTSLGSLAAAEPLQQPQEAGGQTRFLERMLCKRGEVTSAGVASCTREQGQKAIVVSNTPTYSYGPGALANTANDAASFEALMLRYDVDLVISGALGFNGLYYTFAPGIHEPCPGGDHPARAPAGDLPQCTGGAPTELPDAAALLGEQGFAGAYPTLIASGAGGKFGPDGDLPADGPAGQWHGYSVAHIADNGEVTFEQRPILDWIGVDAPEHTVGARERLRLRGWGRSPISTSEGGSPLARHYEISGAAITHRYDLLLADSEEPWLPCRADDGGCAALHSRLVQGPRSLDSAAASGSGSARDDMDGASASATTAVEENPCEPYLCLPERIGTVDRWSGEVTAGNGKYPDTFAVAMLSVDDKVATWPLVFKRSPAFVVNPAAGLPVIPSVPTGTGSAPSPPQPPNPPQPSVPQPSLPQAPSLPGMPPLSAAAPPEPQPPAPPAPPPPTEQPSPLSLTLAPPGIAIATPTAVIQPPTPPVNPAPPGGARREARQRQAAAQKSGADNEETESGRGVEGESDLAQGRPDGSGMAMRRHDRRRPEPSFTALARADQPSAWAQGALYGGGIALMAAVLALGWSHGRPIPRRRTPDLPAPALSWAQSRRRR